MTLNVLHVNNIDSYGRRFNGFDLLTDLRSRGISGKQAVLDKRSESPDVFSLWKEPIDPYIHEALVRVERRRSMNNLLFPWGRVLEASPEFAEADVVHYHLLHNQVIGLYDLPRLFRAKPSIWTFHDPWPLTGHCVYPQTSTGWLNGCYNCPFLSEQFPLKEDLSHQMWLIKKRVLDEADVDIVVASAFMRDMVARSPLTAQIKSVHVIPFGVDLDAFLPESERERSRRALGISVDSFVLLVRATRSPVKGLSYILHALESKAPKRPTTILTVDQQGLVRSLGSRYQVIDLGWIDGPELARAYSASDVLLMPSTGEAFGLMAVEAMASGRPVISFEGTSLPSITRAPDIGVAVPMGDANALRAAIDRLTSDPVELHSRSIGARQLAAAEYGDDRYLDALAKLYSDVARRVRP